MNYYEVVTRYGASYLTNADNAKMAKEEIKKRQMYPSTFGMKANKINISHPEAIDRPLNDEDVLEAYVGKDIVIYDEHHGTATRIKKATLGVIQHFIDEYTTIIIL